MLLFVRYFDLIHGAEFKLIRIQKILCLAYTSHVITAVHRPTHESRPFTTRMDTSEFIHKECDLAPGPAQTSSESIVDDHAKSSA